MDTNNASRARVLNDETPYVVIDSRTGFEVYRTTYSNRTRARRLADRKDNTFGAVRFICRPIFS